MEARLIRITAFAIAAIILLGSLSIWAVSTQERASVGVGEIFEVDIEPNEEVEEILEPTAGISGNIEEDKHLFDIILHEDYPKESISGSLHLFNSGEVEEHLQSLAIEMKAEEQTIGNLTLSNGRISFQVENGWDGEGISISTTGEGSYNRKEGTSGVFDLHFMLQVDEVQEGVRSEEDIAIDTVELDISSTEGGSVVQPGEGTFEYEQGTIVDLEAVAEENSPFVEWIGDNETIEDTTADQTTIEMLDNYAITAVFDVVTYDLTINSTEGGSVIQPGEGTYTYDEGEIVELEAVAEEGYQFVEWTGDIDNIDDPTANQTTIEMLDNYSITAEFAPMMYELTIDSTEGGDVTEPGEGTFEYEHGTIVDLEAVADENTPFIRWSGDNETIEDSTENQTTIEMLDNYAITAVFDVETYELTIDSTEGGSVIQPGEGTYTYDAGEIVELEAVAEEGYQFLEWTGDIDNIDDPTANHTTIEMLDDYSITAEFEPITYELTIDSTEGGDVTEPGEDTFEYQEGTIVDLEAVADDNYTFIEWTGDIGTVDDPTSNQTTIEMLDNYAITAEFLQDPFFEVEIVDYDDPVLEGQTLEVDYTVTNTGEIEDTQDIEFTVEDQDGNVVRSVTDNDVTLGPGDTYDETFTWTTGEGDAGEYDITVASEDDFEEVTVTVIEGPPVLYPIEELYTDNLEGEIEYLQHDPESDEAYDNWYEALDSEADTELEVEMDSPEDELDGEQTIGVLLRRTDNSDRTPDVTIELYQDGTYIDTLAEELEVADPDGEVHYFNFDAVDLVDPTGEGITLEFIGDRAGGPWGDRNTVEYGAVEWEANTVGTNIESLETANSLNHPEKIIHSEDDSEHLNNERKVSKSSYFTLTNHLNQHLLPENKAGDI